MSQLNLQHYSHYKMSQVTTLWNWTACYLCHVLGFRLDRIMYCMYAIYFHDEMWWIASYSFHSRYKYNEMPIFIVRLDFFFCFKLNPCKSFCEECLMVKHVWLRYGDRAHHNQLFLSWHVRRAEPHGIMPCIWLDILPITCRENGTQSAGEGEGDPMRMWFTLEQI